MMTADFSRGLPDLRAGVYRHWKGRHYLVLGYAHDANADVLHRVLPDGTPDGYPLGERAVVVYVGLELDDAHKGPRLAVRTAEDFFALVCSGCGTDWAKGCPVSCKGWAVGRFEYLGPAWYGWPRVEAAPADTPDATLPADSPVEGAPATSPPQVWAPCPVVAPHEPHGPDAPRPRCPGVPPRHPLLATEEES